MKNHRCLPLSETVRLQSGGLPLARKIIQELKRITGCVVGMLAACAAFQAAADVTVKVDSTRAWQGFVNVTGTNGFANYFFGSPWGLADLRAEFISTNSPTGWPLNVAAVMMLNTNTFDNTDTNIPPYWDYPDGTPNKLLESNFYVDVFTNFAGQTVTFEGTVISNTIPLADLSGLPGVSPSSWHVVAWIKEFTAPGYGFVGITTTADNLSPGPFTVTRTIGAGNIAQYGFYTFGPNTAPGSEDSMKALTVLVEDSDPAILTQPVGQTVTTGTSIQLSVDAVGSATLDYQWKRDGTNVNDGGSISGATTANLTIDNAQLSDSGSYTVTVSDVGGSVDSTAAAVSVLDILITTAPADQRVEEGSTVVFAVEATSPSSLTYQWSFVGGGGTNTLSDGPDVSGSSTDTLTLSNVAVSDTGRYEVTISTSSGSTTVGAILLVKSYADFVNFLENPGFESDPNGLDESPWIRFPSSDPSYGAFQDANDIYFGGGNVNVHEGDYVSFTSYNGEYSGIYQDVAAQPGQIFSGDIWFYNASGDPIPGPSTSSTNENYLEIQFRNAGGQVINQYITEVFDYTFPQDTWINLQATNAGAYSQTGTPATEDGPYLVAPPGTTTVRFQVTMHDIANSLAAGSLYYDSARLLLKIPVAVTVGLSGGNVDLSWKSQGATSYQVQYKDDIGDPGWTDLEVVAGDGTVVTRSYPTSGDQRLYRVLTL